MRQRNIAFAAVVVMALAAGVAMPSGARADEPEIITYTVQPGDSIWSIAEAFYGSGTEYQIIYKHNTFIGKPPYLLKPGQELRLPVGDVSPEAQVTWTQRDVKAKPPKAVDWLAARSKMNLWKQYKVSTGDDSAVSLVFEDKSDLRLRENALLVIYGGSAQRTKQQKTKVVLEQGTIRGGLASLDGEPAPMEIETPSGNVEIFAQLTQIQADLGSSMVSVYDGHAKVRGTSGPAVEVQQGFGTVVQKGKAPEPPRPLPGTPAWDTVTGADGVVLALVPQGGMVDFKASWKPVDGATEYRVELAHDKAFHEVFIDATVAATAQQAFLMKDLQEGTVFARVAARDALGLEGPATTPIELRVVGVESTRALMREDDGTFSCVGLTRLSLPSPAAEQLEWRLGSAPFAPGVTALRLRTPGQAVIDVRRVGTEEVSQFAVDIHKASVQLGDPSEPIMRRSPERDVLVSVIDEHGRPAVLPGTVIEASPGGVLKATERNPGEYLVKVAAPEKERAVGVRVAWVGGVLGERVYPVANADEDTVPFEYEWRDATPVVETENRFVGTGMVPVIPEGFVGFHARAASEEDLSMLSFTLVGEVALLHEKLGLDAGLTFFQSSLDSEIAEDNGLGDLVLGARYIVLTEGMVDLAPSIRVRVPFSERDGSRVAGIEPGVMARFTLAPGYWIDTRQALMIASDFGDVGTFLSYDGNLLIGARPLEMLSLGLELDASVSLSTPDGAESWAGIGVGAGAFLHLGRLRLGVNLGLGLGEDGRSHFGDISGMLTLDVGYGGPESE
ncbi:MAG: LysM peptidoglycan-binding domain-containing protein [Deltaproteobacteria bacterium]|nr:MAG: LysM peptidoglycan-binding domain-containing protein [Deltaproteobacteria bacterium]